MQGTYESINIRDKLIKKQINNPNLIANGDNVKAWQCITINRIPFSNLAKICITIKTLHLIGIK
jgi:hypothetical protein